ncbi:MAG: aminomethyl-transferring glycine dehydrogenase subunit GcvPA [Peptococcaceae bacterium]|nr:aminomethyl-transferring glycine dehydrogenase subunit GcvPA [Peptococcaceae bacterium]
MGGYIPNTTDERQTMLAASGYDTFAELFADIPDDLKLQTPLDLPAGKSECEVRQLMRDLAAQNRVYREIFRGAGAYRHYIPAMVTNVLAKENFQTAYTPYQAEISQGILQSIFEYQTMICDLTGMDVSNASVYDGANAAAEAIAMCRGRKQHKALVAQTASPAVRQTIATYAFGNEMTIVEIPEKDGRVDLAALEAALDESVACVYIQHPNYYGNLEEAAKIGELAHAAKAKFIMGVNPMTLALVKSPREYGADIAVGDGQPLGLPLGFGGPYLGFMATTQKLMRQLPGRIVGQTTDAGGKTGYVLTLQAREQHIRREKASSNICSNQALCALAVGVYLSTMGPGGLRQVAEQSMAKAHYLAQALVDAGLALENTGGFFHEFVTTGPVRAEVILAALDAAGILGGLALDEQRILWCCTEMNSKAAIDEVAKIVREVCANADI